MYAFDSTTKFPFFAAKFCNINRIISASESASSATSKEDNFEMYKREFDLKDEELQKHSSVDFNTLGNSKVEAYQVIDGMWLNHYRRETERNRTQQQENMRKMQGEVPRDIW